MALENFEFPPLYTNQPYRPSPARGYRLHLSQSRLRVNATAWPCIRCQPPTEMGSRVRMGVRAISRANGWFGSLCILPWFWLLPDEPDCFSAGPHTHPAPRVGHRCCIDAGGGRAPKLTPPPHIIPSVISQANSTPPTSTQPTLTPQAMWVTARSSTSFVYCYCVKVQVTYDH